MIPFWQDDWKILQGGRLFLGRYFFSISCCVCSGYVRFHGIYTGFWLEFGVLTLFLRYVVVLRDFLGPQVLFDLTSRQFLGYPVSGSRQGTEKVNWRPLLSLVVASFFTSSLLISLLIGEAVVVLLYRGKEDEERRRLFCWPSFRSSLSLNDKGEKIEEKLARGYCNCCSFNLFKSSSFVMLSSMAFKGSAFFVDQNSSSLSLVGLGLDLKSRGEKSWRREVLF